MKNLIFVYLLVLTVIGCSDGKELLKNNDPSKYQLEENVVWASPEGFDLTLDIYSPVLNRGPYPVLVIFHGGGWLINDNSIMDQMSQYLATNSEYVICNVNYRLLSDQDNSVTLDEIVEDAFGAVIWIKHNISKYKGDNSRIAVTGDSAGAHLSAMIVNSGTNLSSDEEFRNNLSFTPTYLPNGKTAEQASKENVLNVQAAILSYGAFDVYKAGVEGLESSKNPFWLFSRSKARGVFGKEYSPINNPAMYKALSPIYNIPEREEKILPPQLLLVGSEDGLTTPLSVKEYATKLESFGQETEYWEYANRNHAFLDSGSNLFLGSSFEKDAPQALDKMIDFLDTVFKL